MADYDDDEFPDDDEFDDYNPHPYGGGYDISATYGAPRPPSSATCYPVSTRSKVTAPTAPQPSSIPPAPAPAPPPSAPRTAPAPAPAASPPAQPRPSSPPPPPAEPYYWPEPYNWGDAPRDQPMYASPEVFRGWPYFAAAQCRSACGRDYWRHCMRGLDYLFGHSDGYGERRIGVDCSGVPVYANRKGAVEDAVVVEVPPPATETVEWHYADDQPDHHHQSNHLSWYNSAQEETYANAEPAYTSYGRPYYEQSYSYQSVSDEPSWFSNQSYQEAYKEQDDSQYQDYFSYDAYKISSQPTVCYNQHFGEQPLHIHVEPPETVSSHKLEYYENFSTYATENDFDNSESSRNSYEIQPYLYTPCDQLEPYRPSWSQNLGHYQAYAEGVSSEYDNHTMASGESWDISSLFMSPYYPQETLIYEHSYGDENV
ncbi:hypothetical protein QOZ80_7BG0613210 [Eleusine coracana subsp. coracana]|nr:hypothetical protein QOZ80_7BG0613210 [Eleusine coracana subsp. coracana]